MSGLAASRKVRAPKASTARSFSPGWKRMNFSERRQAMVSPVVSLLVHPLEKPSKHNYFHCARLGDTFLNLHLNTDLPHRSLLGGT